MADKDPEADEPSRAVLEESVPAVPVGSLSSTWSAAKPDVRAEYVAQIMTSYTAILVSFLEEANRQAAFANQAQRSYQRWRACLIILAGLLALLNLVATQDWIVRDAFVFAAAGFAVVLAILTNLESFYNYSDRAQIYRESRELFLDAYREFDMLWNTHVLPYHGLPESCLNAAVLYRRITTKDEDLRRKLKKLTTADQKAGGGN